MYPLQSHLLTVRHILLFHLSHYLSSIYTSIVYPQQNERRECMLKPLELLNALTILHHLNFYFLDLQAKKDLIMALLLSQGNFILMQHIT